MNSKIFDEYNPNLFDQKLSMTDEAWITNPDGSIDFLKENHYTKMIGEIVTETLDLNGKVLFTSSPEYNDIVMTGSTLVLEKIFGVRANLIISTLSQDMNINPSVAPSTLNLPTEQIIGFMVGYGGAGSTIGDVISVNYVDKTVASIIPFRMVAAPLATLDAAPYFMVGQVSGQSCYYGKKFENTPQIMHLFTDGTDVPANITTTSKGIRVFAEMVCVVSTTDIREYFNSINGNLDQCRVNSLSLVSGYPAGADYGGIRIATKINFRSRYLTNNSDSLRITYRVYCI